MSYEVLCMEPLPQGRVCFFGSRSLHHDILSYILILKDLTLLLLLLLFIVYIKMIMF
jgi:hypothetical protein